MRKKLSPAKKRRKRNERLKRRKRNDNLSKLMRTRTKYISTVTIVMTLLIHQIVLLLGGRGCSTHRVRKNLELDIMVPLGEPFLVGRMVFLVKFGTFFDSIIFCNRFEMDSSVSGFKPENMVSKSPKCVAVFSSSAASLLT